MTRSPLLRTVVLAVTLVALAAVGVALATTRSKTVSVATGQTKAATAGCPAGKKLVLGGFKTTTNVNQGVVINSLKPGARQSWSSRAHDFGTPGSLTSIAYCGHFPKVKTKTKSSTIAAGARGSATATCRRGSSVVLGGYSSPSNSSTVVDSLKRPSPRKWKATAANNSSSSHPLTAIAECAKGTHRYSKREKTVSFTAGTETTVPVSCPAGKRVAMGGFDDSPFNGDYISELARTSARKWVARTWSFSPGSLTAIVYCR